MPSSTDPITTEGREVIPSPEEMIRNIHAAVNQLVGFAVGVDQGADVMTIAKMAADIAFVRQFIEQLVPLMEMAQQLAPLVEKFADGGAGGLLALLGRR